MSAMAFTRAKPENAEKIRRFWTGAAAGPAEGNGSPVLLDGRTARTPGGQPLILPTGPLAARVAEEWAAQGELLEIASMPLTRLAFTVVDHVSAKREAVAGEVARYAGSDLLCYFAEGPEPLLQRQVEHWGPVLEWAECDLGLDLVRATGIIHTPQPPQTLERVETLALQLDDFRLGGVAWATPLFGSAILALALQRGRLSGETAFELSRLDEAFQEERWGIDAEAAERTANLRRDARALDDWFRAL